ncbi:MAG: class I SAM-dependent methyltransferase [Paludibacterium sp.]|uniref:class I SAM-dependent methyltransferase n=1 Tax=Paludibacterium sp. TaxID=1917523 RepID=UPI0025EB6B16|nr:class I SAM-dependent methyltransferase [Paludibacterium sp.]MBV8047306.1 class I SAM-dependent methyltransferase [Paludibacterium sp.]MBV8646631.1 class I SAM-dependent methyltransferase [Paludibacterium sp.]
MSVRSFDEFYGGCDNYYGTAATGQLIHYMQKYGVNGPGDAMDLGCGQGRNALYLGHHGYRVTGVDCSAVAIDDLNRQADSAGLSVQGIVADIVSFPLPSRAYQMIVAHTSLDHLNADDGRRVARRIMAALAPGGILFAAVFLDDDPGCHGREQASETAGHIKHYYRPEEFLDLFADLTVLAYQQERSLDTSHGEAHYHSTAFLFARYDG